MDESRARAPERRQGTEQGWCEGEQHERREGAGDEWEGESDRELAGGGFALAAAGRSRIVGQSVEHGRERQALTLGRRDRRRDLARARPERGGQRLESIGQSRTAAETCTRPVTSISLRTSAASVTGSSSSSGLTPSRAESIAISAVSTG